MVVISILTLQVPKRRKTKKRKKKHRGGRQKKDPAFRRRRRQSNKRAQEHFISGGGLFGLLPNQILEGVGDSLSTATDRCSYCVSVPNMYRIVGREGVAALRTERWHEGFEALRQKWAARAAEKKRKQKEIWEATKRDYDAVGGTPFNGTKAIAKRHNVSAARLKRFADRRARRCKVSDTDSSACIAATGSDDSWDGDSDATF